MVKINSVGLFLQVRLNSNRMPGKALLNLSGKLLINHVIDRLSVVPADHRVILTSNESYDVLKPIADEAGWDIFAGNSQNVLKRFVDAAVFYEVDTVIRATGDNPLSSSEIAIQTIELFNKTNADLAYLAPVPYGSGVEVVKTSALVKALSKSDIPYDLEHVTPFIYKNPNEFKIVTEKYHNDEAARGEIRLTVDTRDDFERVNFFIKKINQRKLNLTMHSVVNVWDELQFNNFRTALIITNSGDEFGLFHIKRSLVIASLLKDTFTITLTQLSDNKDDEKYMKKSGFDYVSLDEIEKSVLKDGMYDRVIVDVKNTTLEQMNFFLSLGPVFSIDDAGEGTDLAFMNLNSFTISSEKNDRYNFEGLEYVFINETNLKREKINGLKKILISFGAVDSSSLTNRVLRGLQASGYEITVIIGTYFNEKIEPFENIKIIYSPDSLEEFIRETDLVITSFGMTFFETMKCETPALLLNNSYYYDSLTKQYQYNYFIKKDLVDDSYNFEKTLIDAIKEMENDKCFLPDSEVLQNLYKCTIGSKVNDIIRIIDESSPSVLLCSNCCNLTVKTVGRNNDWNMYKCENCGLYFIDYLVEKKIKYDNDYFFKEYKEQYGKTYEEDRENIRKFAEIRLKMIKKYIKSGTLLDFGSGLGFFAEYAQEHGFKSVCYDISEYAVDYIKNTLHINAFVADNTIFEKNSDTFDVIASFYVLEHIADYEKIIFMFNKHLNKNGVLALSTPNGVGYSINKKTANYLKHHPNDHFHIFNPDMLKKVLMRNGFKNIKIRITGIHPSRFITSEKLLSNKFVAGCIRIYAKIFKFGDTFEIYAQKE